MEIMNREIGRDKNTGNIFSISEWHLAEQIFLVGDNFDCLQAQLPNKNYNKNKI